MNLLDTIISAGTLMVVFAVSVQSGINRLIIPEYNVTYEHAGIAFAALYILVCVALYASNNSHRNVHQKFSQGIDTWFWRYTPSPPIDSI